MFSVQLSVFSRYAAPTAVNGPILRLGIEYRNRELRTATLGATTAGRVLVLVLVETDPDSVRAVTAYPANRKLRAAYRAQIGEAK